VIPFVLVGAGRRGSVRRVPDLTPQLLAEITSLGKTVLLVVAITFIVWALYTAMIVPKKHPQFPRDLNLYIVITAALFVAQMGAVLWVTGTQEVEHEAAGEVEGGGGEETTPTETSPTETTPTGTTGDAVAGKAVFESAGCGSCHALADAGTTGAIGPNLDDAKPPTELVVERVTNGMGAMPSFSDSLTEQQITDVAAYVSSSAGSAS
jgi:mono/diheme cytochrome c family protein